MNTFSRHEIKLKILKLVPHENEFSFQVQFLNVEQQRVVVEMTPALSTSRSLRQICFRESANGQGSGWAKGGGKTTVVVVMMMMMMKMICLVMHNN